MGAMGDEVPGHLFVLKSSLTAPSLVVPPPPGGSIREGENARRRECEKASKPELKVQGWGPFGNPDILDLEQSGTKSRGYCLFVHPYCRTK